MRHGIRNLRHRQSADKGLQAGAIGLVGDVSSGCRRSLAADGLAGTLGSDEAGSAKRTLWAQIAAVITTLILAGTAAPVIVVPRGEA